MTLEELRRYKPQIEALAAKYHCGNVRVFGSVVKGTAAGNSDVDFLITTTQQTSLFDLGGLHYHLEELLQSKVDVVPDRSEIFFPSILREAVPL